MKKAAFIVGIASALIDGSMAASSASSLGQPTVSVALKNNSSDKITLGKINCGGTPKLPENVPAHSTGCGSVESNFSGVMSCGFQYKISSGNSCQFTISRLSTVGNPMLGTKDQWKYPSIYLTSGSSSQCSGRIISASQNNSGDFSVELNYDFY